MDRTKNNRTIWGKFKKSRFITQHSYQLYIMMIPCIMFLLLFRYIPMGGIILAFKDYNIFKGIIASDWVGLAHFKELFTSYDFYEVLGNTLVISLIKIVFGFPAPIILALLINELRSVTIKRISQNIFYIPHFLSWVIIAGFAFDVFSKQSGVINKIITFFGGEPIFFMQEDGWFRVILVATDLWKSVGWSTIIYMAALTGVNPELYNAAMIDGANRWKQTIYITIPSIIPVVTILLILRISSLINIGQDQILMLQNPMVMDSSEVIDTYVYHQGLQGFKYSYSTAVGFFKSIVALVLIISANMLTRKVGGNSIW